MRWTTCSEEQLVRVAEVLERTFGVEVFPLEDHVLRACRKHLPKMLADAGIQSAFVSSSDCLRLDEKKAMYFVLDGLVERLLAVLSEDRVELLLDPRFDEAVALLRERMPKP